MCSLYDCALDLKADSQIQLFQFSDLLLLCSSRLLPAGISAAYRLRAKFWLEDTQILEGDDLLTENTFYLRDSHKNVELYTQ
jgi:hypothetical protein